MVSSHAFPIRVNATPGSGGVRFPQRVISTILGRSPHQSLITLLP